MDSQSSQPCPLGIQFRAVPLLEYQPLGPPLLTIGKEKDKGKEKPQRRGARDDGDPAEPHLQVTMPVALQFAHPHPLHIDQDLI